MYCLRAAVVRLGVRDGVPLQSRRAENCVCLEIELKSVRVKELQ